MSNKSKKPKFVKVSNKGYGKRLRGLKIYFEGRRPGGLSKDGTISFGKHILELLTTKFEKFRWIVTEETDSITKERGIFRVRTSLRLLTRLNKRYFGRSRDIKNDLVRNAFASNFPDYFQDKTAAVYVPGTLADILTDDALPHLSSSDSDALRSILPKFIASESMESVNLLKAHAQIQSLKELATDMENALGENRSEAWWQTYVQSKILIIQQGYIKAIEKINIVVGNTKFPDFSLVTHDSYLDILEIKKPATNLLKKDESRGNFYWDTEISKAIVQVENYIASVARHAPSIREYLLDQHKLNLQVLIPRGIIIAGDRRGLTEQKQKDDFRLLSHASKNITILTYDELLIRLRNYIEVLEQHRIRE